MTAAPVQVTARLGPDGAVRTFTGCLVLGCDGAGSTIRDLTGITMEDLGFTERWLVVDIRVEGGLPSYEGVEQVCDPARAATFMQVTGDRYRWEFQLRDGEDEADLITPQALGAPAAALDRAALTWPDWRSSAAPATPSAPGWPTASRPGGSSSSATPPTSPRRSSARAWRAGLRDADNLAWKIAHVLTGRAGEDLLDTYDAERRPHARAMVKKAVRIGWAMTGGQDRAAAVRRMALAAAVRSVAPPRRHGRHRDATAEDRRAATGTRRRPRRAPAPRVGGLIPNPLVRLANGARVRLDTLLAGRTAVLTARRPEAALVDLCRQHGLLLIRISTGSGPGGGDGVTPAGGEHVQASGGYAARADSDPGPADCGPARAGARWTEARLAGDEPLAVRQTLTADPALAVVIRPDGVVAAVTPGRGLPRLPWAVRPGPYPPPPGTVVPDEPGTTVPHPRLGQAVPPGP